MENERSRNNAQKTDRTITRQRTMPRPPLGMQIRAPVSSSGSRRGAGTLRGLKSNIVKVQIFTRGRAGVRPGSLWANTQPLCKYLLPSICVSSSRHLSFPSSLFPFPFLFPHPFPLSLPFLSYPPLPLRSFQLPDNPPISHPSPPSLPPSPFSSNPPTSFPLSPLFPSPSPSSPFFLFLYSPSSTLPLPSLP